MTLEDALDYDLGRDLWCVLGLPFDSVDLLQAELVVRTRIRERRQVVLSTPNVNWVVAAISDRNFRDAAIRNELCTADGMPIVWIARMFGLPFTERVGGSDLIENLLNRTSDSPLSIFLLGGEKGVAERAYARINARGGGLEAVGYLYPGHGSVEEMSNVDAIEAINAAAPDILLVALGARKGQAWIERNRDRLNAKIVSHLGATINFLAGTVNRAPSWMRRSGLEWGWRIVGEPKLVNRYMRDGVVLVWLFVTRLLPYWMLLRARRRARCSEAALEYEVDDTKSELRVTLRGEATRRTQEAAKAIVKKVVLKQRDITLDLAGVDYIDSAFVALLIIVHKHMTRMGRVLRVEGCSFYVNRIVRYNCAEFLLTDV